jgi:outer membrane protein
MRKNILDILLINFCILFVIGKSDAQQSVSLTIEQAITSGLENSKSLHSSMMKVEYSDAKSSETSALLYPSLKFGGSYTRLSEVPPFKIQGMTISPSVFDNYNMRLTLQQPLFTGLRLINSSRVASYSAQASEKDYQKDKTDLIYNVTNTYWSLFKAIEFKKVVDENVEQVKAHLKDVQNFFNQGIVTKNEVLKVEVQLSNVQVLQIDAMNNVQVATIGLNSLIGLPLETKVDLTSKAEQTDKQYDNVNTLVQKAIDSRPDIKSMELRVKAGEAGVSIAHAGWFPQIYLTGNYVYARPNQRIFPTQDKFKDTWDVSVSASFDIWNWGTTIHQTDEAQAQLAQVKDGLGLLRDGITLEVTQSYLNFNQSKEKINVTIKGVNQAEENYRVTDEKFKAGLALNSDLLDAEAALMQAKFNHIQSLVDFQLADARLQKAIGRGN